MKLIECVTNYSEGRDRAKIEQICSAIRGVECVTLLHCDIGYAANRTVITFAGEAQALCEAAFRGAKCAAEVIDMRTHHGEHPRLGATDVLPLVPLENITLEECAQLARQLARRLSEELSIPTYCYGKAAMREERDSLAICRKGEYESLPRRVLSDDAPDFGARPYDELMARTGATNVGARDFLVAVNFNIDSTDPALAHQIALDVRESSHRSTSLKCCRAIGWYIEEYGCAQVSTNLIDISITPLHLAYRAICSAANSHGTSVTGVEIIGLLPKRVLEEAGEYFAQNSTSQLSEQELIRLAIDEMNLGWREEFIPQQRVIEYLIQ